MHAMRNLRALLLPVILSTLVMGCASSSRDDEVKQAKELEFAANVLVDDQAKLADALDESEAWLAAGTRRELDAFAAKGEAEPVGRLRKIIAAQRALEDLRSVTREIRRRAAALAVTVAALEDPGSEDSEIEEVSAELVRLRLTLKTDRREQEIAQKRWHAARAALGKEAFAPAVEPKAK
jgi:hypothetical protein